MDTSPQETFEGVPPLDKSPQETVEDVWPLEHLRGKIVCEKKVDSEPEKYTTQTIPNIIVEGITPLEPVTKVYIKYLNCVYNIYTKLL